LSFILFLERFGRRSAFYCATMHTKLRESHKHISHRISWNRKQIRPKDMEWVSQRH